MAAWAQAIGIADTGKGGRPMRIERRDPTLKYPRAIREEKLRLVLDWLLEFQFSSVDLLARRLGLTYQSSYKFFRALIKRHYSGVYYLFDREPDLVHYQMLSRPGRGPSTTTIARSTTSRRSAPTSGLMPSSTYAIVFSSFTSPTHTRDSLQKRGVG